MSPTGPTYTKPIFSFSCALAAPKIEPSARAAAAAMAIRFIRSSPFSRPAEDPERLSATMLNAPRLAQARAACPPQLAGRAECRSGLSVRHEGETERGRRGAARPAPHPRDRDQHHDGREIR